MAVDWTKSGIYNRIGVELVDPRSLKTVRWFTGKVTGGSITEDYRSEYRSSATLEVDGDTIPLSCAVRIWHVAEDLETGQSQRSELGTFWPEPSAMDYDHGRYHGTVEMHSALKRLGTDLRKDTGSVPKGAVCTAQFSKYVRNSGGIPVVGSGVSTTRKLSKAHVWNHGESVLAECQRLADALGAWIGVDTHGRVKLEHYIAPSKRASSFSVPRGKASMVEVGTVGYESNEVYNRFIAYYEQTRTVNKKSVKKSYYDMAEVSTSHPWHPNKIGRFVVYDAGTPTFSKEGSSEPTESEIKAELKKLVEKARDEHSNHRKVWDATMLYWPSVQVGKVGTFYYQDNPDSAAISKKVFVAQRELKLDGTMRMELTLEEL